MLTIDALHVIVSKRMKRAASVLIGLVCGIGFWLGLLHSPAPAIGEDAPLVRQTTIQIAYTEYEWWLLKWLDSSVVCRIYIDHEGLPKPEEVAAQCSLDVYRTWQSTPPCEPALVGSFDTFGCKGLYLHFISSKPSQKELVIELPLAAATVTLEGCQPTFPENRCPTLPNLFISGQEPLPNERIVAIEGLYADQPFYCEGESCSLPLKPTPLEGVEVQFWAISSYGDTSPKYKAFVRVVDTGVRQTPSDSGWYVDVLSSQWLGNPLASCAETWQAFQPVGGPPLWLSSTTNTDLLSSDEPYYYLAGRLISQGVVDASTCPSGGLLPNGYADVCGLELARPYLQAWQNQFDAKIIEAANENGVPAQFLKNIFAQESQFWPGIFKAPFEFGLGQITDLGAEALLLWNDQFYSQFCPLILAQETCDQGYLHLSQDHQAMLRGALAIQAKADCPECPAGIDLTNTFFSIPLFAKTVRANCDQIAQIVYNATGEMPGRVSNYEDLWRMTAANYHVGPGCLSYAVHQTVNNGLPLTWENITQYFTEPCKSAIPYVEKVAR